MTHSLTSSRRPGHTRAARAVLAAVVLSASACGSDATSATTQPAADTTTSATTPLTADTTIDQPVTYPLTATGQVDCYDADGVTITCSEAGAELYGQDANYVSGDPMAFEDNGDGTVTDLVTGLTWQQSPPSDDLSWQEAVEYADDLELGGYDDWRLPTVDELFSISNFGLGWPYLDTTYFSLASGEVSKDEQYWTNNAYVGTTMEGGDSAVFGINAVTGHIKAYPGEAMGPVGGKYVRVVRGDVYGTNSFTDNGDGTITDAATGLMWAQADDGAGMEWPDALDYAESAELAGYDDWRLPNVKELQSIVDYSRSPSSSDPDVVGPAIDELFTVTAITNEAGEADYGYAWTSTSAMFTAGEPYYYAWYVAFGRAVNDDGEDVHGAGAVRFDTKIENGPNAEGGERYFNYVRLVRDA